MTTIENTQLELVLDDSMPELEQYSVKVSARARSVNLQVLPLLGLQVTIPKRFPRREIPELLRANRSWIEKQQRKVADTTDPEFLQWPPMNLRLLAIDETLQVNYTDTNNGTILRASLDGDCLNVTGRPTNKLALAQLFSTILKKTAKHHLEPQIRLLSEQHNLTFKRLVIRGQKTLWGSYSSSGTLSLNYKLLFLPAEHVRYVLLHELTHIKHLNHSRAFWQLLVQLEPDARRLDAELADKARLVPPWLEAIS